MATTTSTRPVAAPPLGDDPVTRLFASRSVAEHVVRGVVGLVLVVLALAYAGTTAWALLLVVPAVVAWRGCPTCWALGLAATLSRGRAGCDDGACRGR
ncbi:hypothetical protein SAMN04488570_0421 [Nocardioides scoriae]|uniref:Uncharacterized protein n=1 Tax=Nocardioides scoriae TaxID=642780 RepID=A0A1H1M1S3_9ACTN|nr:hypothetical protein [Nocardioides scoriae]SDR79959.1 hypothetical protein SAMN04488570_0421 [Nocardioides scoriae]